MTRNGRPPTSLPLRLATAASPSALFDISQTEPLDRPVSRSVRILTEETSPNSAKASHKLGLRQRIGQITDIDIHQHKLSRRSSCEKRLDQRRKTEHSTKTGWCQPPQEVSPLLQPSATVRANQRTVNTRIRAFPQIKAIQPRVPSPDIASGLRMRAPDRVKVPLHSTDDPSRLTALLVGRTGPIFPFLASRRSRGARRLVRPSTVETGPRPVFTG